MCIEFNIIFNYRNSWIYNKEDLRISFIDKETL